MRKLTFLFAALLLIAGQAKTAAANTGDSGSPDTGSVGDVKHVGSVAALRALAGDGSVYTVSNQGNGYGVALPPDFSIDGRGATITTGLQNFRLFQGAANDISIQNLNFSAASTSGQNDANSAIFLGAGKGPNQNISLGNLDFLNTSWGAIVSSESSGAGCIYNTRISGSSVRSNTALPSNYDGFHTSGCIYGATIAGSTVFNRGDAAFANDMQTGYAGAAIAYSGDTALDSRIGVDFTGTQFGVASGGVFFNRYADSGSNPAMRVITQTSPPLYDILSDSIAFTNSSRSGEFDVKVTAAGAATQTAVEGLMLSNFYTDAAYVEIKGNTFVKNPNKGGVAAPGIQLATTANQIIIGTNDWEIPLSIGGQAAPSRNVVVLARQNYDRSNPENFLPAYPGSTPFWTSWQLDGIPVQPSGFPYTAANTAFTAVPGAYIYLPYAAIVSGIDAIATPAGESTAQIAIADLSGKNQVIYYFAAGKNAVATPSYPAVAGNTYYAKLAAGLYQIQVSSGVAGTTFNYCVVHLWY